MSQMIMDSFREFTGGVVTTGLSSRLPRSTSPKGWNSILKNVGPQSATPAKRPGCKTVNTTRVSSYPVNCQIEYLTYSAGVPTRYHIGILGNGEIGYISSDYVAGTGAWTSIGATTFATSQGKNVGYTIGKNLLFMVDGTVAKKLRGTTLENIGIVRPSTNCAAAAGAAGGMTGTYEIRYTFVNGNTNHESSASESSSPVTVAGKKLDLSSVDVSADAQVTKRNIYIRNTATQVTFRLAGSINDNTSTTATIDVDTTTLTILAPNTTQNDPPPSGITSVAWWQSYLFAADDQNIYWSTLNKPEAFFVDDYEPVGGLDGQKITGLYPFGPALLIFKERSVYILTGRTPASFQLKPLFTDVGSLSQRSVIAAGGALYWWSHRGPVRWEGSGYPEAIAELAFGQFPFGISVAKEIQAAVDETTQLVLWTYSESDGTSANQRILPWNYRLNVWTSNRWDPMGVASMVSMQSSNGVKWVYYGNYNGQFFRFNDPTSLGDGIPWGTVSGGFVAGATSILSITDSGFYDVESQLMKRVIVIEDANHQYVGRSEITSNTSTVLTLTDAITGLVVGASYTYHIGGPNFEWVTPLEDSGKPFLQKRYRTLHIKTDNGAGLGGSPLVAVDIFTDEDRDTPQSYQTFSDNSAEKATISTRLVASEVALEWQASIHNRASGIPLTLLEVSMLSEVLTEKIGQ